MNNDMGLLDRAYLNFSCLSTTIKTIRRNMTGKKFESEVYVLKNFVEEGNTCFDIGAAYGRYAYHFSPLVGRSGQVFCFEPGAYSLKVLKRVVGFHNLKNVKIINQALSNVNTTAELTIPYKGRKRIGPSLAHLSTDNSDKGFRQKNVTVTTLDLFCEENNIQNIKFIKCDVEGAEYLVLKGGLKTIEKFKPIVLCEIDLEFLKKNNATPEDFFNIFFNFGYKAFIYREKRFFEVSRHQENHNYFFIPADSKYVNLVSKK